MRTVSAPAALLAVMLAASPGPAGEKGPGDGALVDALAGALKDSDSGVRLQAALTLGRFSDPRAVPPLVEALRSDRDRDVRRQAASALGRFRDSRATEALIVALRDSDVEVRRAAVRALGRRDGEGDTPEPFVNPNPNPNPRPRARVGTVGRD